MSGRTWLQINLLYLLFYSIMMFKQIRTICLSILKI
jgi:hypothetical protein